MELKITDPKATKVYRILGTSEDRMDELITKLDDGLCETIRASNPDFDPEKDYSVLKSDVLKTMASVCDTPEELLSVFDCWYRFQLESAGRI